MSLINSIDPERNEAKFNLGQQRIANQLREAMKKQELPQGFSKDGLHIRQEKLSGMVYISNNAKQMCRLNEGILDMYYICPKCGNDGFKNTIRHSSRCDEIIW